MRVGPTRVSQTEREAKDGSDFEPPTGSTSPLSTVNGLERGTIGGGAIASALSSEEEKGRASG